MRRVLPRKAATEHDSGAIHGLERRERIGIPDLEVVEAIDRRDDDRCGCLRRGRAALRSPAAAASRAAWSPR